MQALETGRRKRGPAPWLHLVPLVAIWLLPTIAISVAIPVLSAREQSIVKPSSALTVTVGSRENDALTAVDVEIGLQEGPSLLVGADGLVTAVPVLAGQAITQGMPLVEVNYQRVLAFMGPSPLYRDLDIGDTGPDVALLGGFLAQLGLMPADQVTNEFGWPDRAAVRALQASIGAEETGHFSLSYLAYVSPDVTTIGEVSVRVGDRVTSTSALTGDTKTATVVRFSPTNTQRSLSPLGDGPLVILAGDKTMKLGSISPSPEEIVYLQDFLLEGEASGVLTSTTSGNGLSTKYTGTRLALAAPVEVGSVPNSALYISASGQQCVFEQGTDAETWSARRTEGATSLSGEIGVTAIEADLIGKVIASDASLLSSDYLARC